MKIIIDKQFTKDFQTEAVKAATKDFRGFFTENDLVRLYEETFGDIDIGLIRNVIKANVSAFASNDYDTNRISFRVSLVVSTYFEYHELSYFIDSDRGMYSVNKSDLLHENVVFKRVI